MRVVVLHLDTMRAGNHHGCIVGSLVRVRFEDNSRFSPRRQPRLQLRSHLTVRAESEGVMRGARRGIHFRQRRDPGRDGAVAGEWLVYEHVGIGDGFAARTGGYGGITRVAC